MLKAAAAVSRKRAEPGPPIQNLQAYLFQTYKHLLLAEMEKENGHRQRDLERHFELTSASDADAETLERKILIQQVIRRMDEWMRAIFELLTLGYSFEEIGRLRAENGHALRSKFHKRLGRLAKELNKE
jgi:DNA-directed RNA polymerase specialized sigma24 family protein